VIKGLGDASSGMSRGGGLARGTGQYTALVAAAATALGPEGLEHLKLSIRLWLQDTLHHSTRVLGLL
jgi:hypothetical protein